MTQTTGSHIEAGTDEKSKGVRDDRRFYRTVLAVVAPLPMLAMGTIYLLSEMPGDGPFRDMVDAAGRQETLLGALLWVEMLFVALPIPALIAVAAATRRRRRCSPPSP